MYGFHDWLEMSILGFIIYALSTMTTGWLHYTLMGISIFILLMQLIIIVLVFDIYLDMVRKPRAELQAETRQMLNDLKKRSR